MARRSPSLPVASPFGVLPAMRRETHFGDRIVRAFADRPHRLGQMFTAAVAAGGDREAIVCEGRRWSYSETDRIVGGFAAGLASAGVGHRDRVAMLIGNRPEFVFVLLAIERLGAISVPISIREQAPGIAYLLGRCGARLLLHDADLADRVPAADQLPAGCRSADVDLLAAPAPALEAVPDRPGTWHAAEGAVSEEDPAVILFTSGTTGRPKGAMLSHLNLVHSAMHFEFCMRLTRDDRSAMAVPASHVTGLVAMIVTMLRVGGTLVIVPAFRAADFLALAAAERITHAILVPAMYNLCLLEPDLDRYDLTAWRIGAYGGAPMPRTTIEALSRRWPSLTAMNAYGATETTSPATLMPAGLQADRLDSVGIAVPTGELLVVDEMGREVPPGEPGELLIGGPMVVAGYWDDTEASAASFVGGFWRSGDLGRVDADGFVQILDRRKDMLNRGGYKIYSVEVENVLAAVPGVIEAAVVGRPCPVLGERVHAVVRVDAALAATPERARNRLSDYAGRMLADYKVPETWSIVDAPLPRNANGKLMKRALRPTAAPGRAD